MVKTAIIGSTSFLGKNLIPILHKEGHVITLFSRKKNTENHECLWFSLPDAIPDLGIFLKFDIIVFAVAAGVQSSNKCSTDEIYELNAFFPIKFAIFLNANMFKGKYITFGSYFEIGSQAAHKNFTEKDLVLSDFRVPNAYCVSKRLLTRFVNDSLLELKHYHIILPSIYGRNENENRLIPYIIKNLKTNSGFELTSGNQIRQYLHIFDVCYFILLLCSKNVEKGMYNLSPEENIRVKDLVEMIFNHFNKDPQKALGMAKRKDESMQILLLDNTKAKDLGWNPTISLNAGISDIIGNI